MASFVKLVAVSMTGLGFGIMATMFANEILACLELRKKAGKLPWWMPFVVRVLFVVASALMIASMSQCLTTVRFAFACGGVTFAAGLLL